MTYSTVDNDGSLAIEPSVGSLVPFTADSADTVTVGSAKFLRTGTLKLKSQFAGTLLEGEVLPNGDVDCGDLIATPTFSQVHKRVRKIGTKLWHIWEYVYSTYSGYISYSTWPIITAVTNIRPISGETTYAMADIASNGTRLVVTVPETSKFAYSDDDGFTWTPYTTSAGAGCTGYHVLMCNGTTFVGIRKDTQYAGSNLNLGYSADGITWTGISLGAGTGYIYQNVFRTLKWENGKFHLGADKNFAVSDDGISWSWYSASLGITGQCWDGTQYWACTRGALGYTASKNHLVKSPDGITWTEVPVPVVTAYLRGVKFANSTLVVVPAVAYARLLYSFDLGVTWKVVPTYVNGYCQEEGYFYYDGLWFLNMANYWHTLDLLGGAKTDTYVGTRTLQYADLEKQYVKYLRVL